jgi:4-amino-4-deoxy-L-arabinose transferase-like glycosyltransferase
VGRSGIAKIGASFLLVLGGTFLILALWPISWPLTKQTQHNRHLRPLSEKIAVGQSFLASRSNTITGLAFNFATFGKEPTSGTIVLRIHSLQQPTEVLREVKIAATQVQDNEFLYFPLSPPLKVQQGKKYMALLTVETSGGKEMPSLTLNVQREGGYEQGALYIWRKGAVQLGSEKAKKSNLDAAFLVYGRVNALYALQDWLREQAVYWRSVWQRDPGYHFMLLRLLAIAFILLSFVCSADWWGRQRWQRGSWGAALLILAAFVLRLELIQVLPVTNDEGFYLYDAWGWQQGFLAGGDGWAKAPVYLLYLTSFLAAGGATIWTARFASVVAGTLATIPLAWAAWRMGNKKLAWITAALWALSGAPVIFGVYAHTQSFQVLLLVLALATATEGYWRVRRSGRGILIFSWREGTAWLLLAGVLLGLALAARKSSVALLLPLLALGFWWLPWRRWGAMFWGVGGFIGGVALFLGMVGSWYGLPGVKYALGLELAKTSAQYLTGKSAAEIEMSLRNVAPLLRENVALLWGGLLGLGVALELIFPRRAGVGRKVAWLVPLLLFWYATNFFREYEAPRLWVWGLKTLWWFLGGTILIMALSPRKSWKARPGLGGRWLSMGSWLVMLTLFYLFWIKFRTNYFAEFLPALTLLAALGIGELFRGGGRVWKAGGGILLIWAAFIASYTTHNIPHTGTFHPSSIPEAAEWLRKHVPRDERILTAAVAIPVMSGHRVVADAAHPTWYAYGFIEDEVRNVFMVPVEEMKQRVKREANWVVEENLTRFSYYREHPEIEQWVRRNFVVVQEIENPRNTIRILRRTPRAD